MQLDWQTKTERLAALGVIWELQRRILEPELILERCEENAPGSAWLTWRLSSVAEADQLQKMVGSTLDGIGWGRHRTPLTQFDA
jgi:hypothetical protein